MNPLSFSNLFRTAVLAVSVVCVTTVLSAQSTAPKKETLNIEQAMRAWQERYCSLTGADQIYGLSNPNDYRRLTWPNNVAGENPGPYPKNCFYAEDMQKPEQAAALVRAFAQTIKSTLDKGKMTGAYGVIRRFDSKWSSYYLSVINDGPIVVSTLSRLFFWRDATTGTYAIRLSTDAAWSPDFDTTSINAANYASKFETLVSHWLATPVRVKWYTASSGGTGINRNFGVVLDGSELVDCDDCACSTGTCRPGECIALNNRGLDLRFKLGTGSRGSLGVLRLRAKTPSAALFTPRALINLLDGRIINSTTASVPEAYSIYDYNQCDAAGIPLLRQLVLPAGLVDIAGDAAGFTMNFYDTANRGTLTSGFYVPGTAYKTVRIEQDGDANHLRMVESGPDAAAQTTGYTYADNAWTRTDGVGADARTVQNASAWTIGDGSAVGDERQETSATRTASSTEVDKTRNTYRIFAWNIDPATSLPYQWENQREELVSSALDPEGKNLISTYRYYDDVTSTDPNYGRLKQVERPDGSWERYEYAADGRIAKEYSSFNDSSAPASAAGPISGDYRLVETVYSTSAPQETTTESVIASGTVSWIGRRFKTVDDTSGTYTVYREELATSVAAAYGDTTNLVTIRRALKNSLYFPAYTERIVRPDGTITLYGYAFNSPATGQTTTTVSEGVPNNTAPLAATGVSDGTITVTKTNVQGQPISEVITDAASGIQLVNTVYADFDTFGRWRLATYNDGTTVTRTYNCCGLESETDRTGMRTVFGYDSLHRQTRRTTYPGTDTTAHSDTEYVLDAAGRTLQIIAHACGASLDATLPTSITAVDNTYNLAGQLTDIVTPRGSTQIDETITAAGKRQVTTTFADGGTRIERFNRAGELESISGTAVAPMKYVYGVDADGAFTQEIRVGEGGAETEWTKSYRDFAGRPSDTVFADGAKIVRTYHAPDDTVVARRGKLASVTQPPDSDATGAIGVRRLFDYNAKGEQSVVALDLDQDGEIDYAGKDRIAKVVSDVSSVTHDGTAYNVRRSTTHVWAADDTDTSTSVSVSETSTDGLRSWQMVHGLSTSTLVAYTANAGRTVTTTAPDETVATQSFIGDRLQSVVTVSGTTQLSGTNYLFDAYGRLERATDARNGSTTYTYYADGAQKTVTTPDPDTAKSGDGYDAQTTQLFYDSMGRLTRTLLPDGAESSASYWPTGALKRTWGARTTPQEMTYDSQGRLKTLATWRDFVDETSFETAAGKAITTWNYSATRGWLESKRYADGRGPSYEYYPSGSLRRRTWARTVDGAALTTDYAYTKARELSGIDYSDSTPDVTGITYDRLGRRTGITDAAGMLTTTFEGLTAFTDDESYAAGSGVLAGLGVNRGRDTKLRPSALEVPTVVAVGYSYRDGSRLDTVSATVDGVTTDHTYSYQTNSSLIDQLVQKRSGATVLTTTKVFDKLTRLTSNTAVSAAATSAAGYLYNSANQRTRLTETDGRYWTFGYDALGQVTGGTKKLADGTAVLGHVFGYTFDTIGNLKTAVVNSQTATYTPNDLNQYTERTVPAFLDVLGTTDDAKAKVAINLAPAQRQGALFYKQLSTDNASVPVWQPIDVLAGKAGAGTDGADAIIRQSGHLFVAQTPEGFGYDFDGNLTSDGQWTYAWNAENQLVAMETGSAAVTAGVPKQKLEFAYDSAGRRVQKMVSNWNGSVYVIVSDTRFLYDGWNLVAEIDGLAGNAVVRSYVWGLDLSGSMQGAGGVGGLLVVNNGSATYLPAYHGNGNVLALVDAASGTSIAKYEYGPFGEPLRVSGPAAAANPFRFSTKYTDPETGLTYYGRRFYYPALRRWIGRDPLGEKGGRNLYRFASNSPIANIDVLGLWTFKGVLGILCGDCEGRKLVEELDRRDIKLWRVEGQRLYLTRYSDATRKTVVDRAEIGITAGSAPFGSGVIEVIDDADDEKAAMIVFHEGVHTQRFFADIKRRMKMTPAERRAEADIPADEGLIIEEKATWLATERWLLSRGAPPAFEQFRRKNGATGTEELDENAVTAYVDNVYRKKDTPASGLPDNITLTTEPENPWTKPEPYVIWQCRDND